MSVDTVSDIEPRVQYTASVSQTDFDYPFPIFADADLVVDIDGVTQALTTDYTVSGAGADTGGTVTLVVAATGGETVTIYRDIAIERVTDFQQNGRFGSAAFNDELDKLIMIQQQLDSAIKRALRVSQSDSTSSTDMELPSVASRASKYLYFNASGDPEMATGVTAGTTLSQSTVGTALYTAQTAAELALGITPTNAYYPQGHMSRYGTGSAALSAALSLGGTVVIPPGTHTLSAPVTASPTRDLVVNAYGAVVNSTITDAGTYQAAIKIITTSRVAINDLALSHSGTDAETLYGIQMTSLSPQVTFNNVRVSGFPYYAAEINATQQTHVGCRYVDNHHAGLAPYGGTWTLIGCECSNNGNGSTNVTGYGVVGSGTGGTIKGGRFMDNDRYGIDGRYCSHLTVDSAYVYNSGLAGIYAVNEDGTKDCENIKVVNCTVDMNNRASSDWAIWVGAYGTARTASPKEILVQGNTVRNGLGVGILVGIGDVQTGADYPTSFVNVSHNQITSMVGNGISIAGTGLSPDSIVVRDNQLKEANEIQVVAAGGVAQILGNSFTYADAETRLIYCSAPTAIIKDNVVNGANTDNGAIEVTSTSYHIADNILGSFCRGSATFDPGSLADGAGETTTVTCAGAALGDLAFASFSLDLAGVLLTAWVSSVNTVSVRFQNETGAGPVDLLSGTLRVRVSKIK